MRLLLEELWAQGVRELVLSPGSRSTPIALGASALPFRRFMALDERSASFFALGMAKATGRPAALACTSGTAVANYLPAVVEASHAHVPLLLLTADRPPELRGVGAAQTIEQREIYGRFVRWFQELPADLPDPQARHFTRHSAARAVAEALGAPMGPVHLNLPLREPLLEEEPLPQAACAEATPYTLAPRPCRAPHPQALARAQAAIARARRVLLFAGPSAAPRSLPDLAALAFRLQAPLLADALSQQRAEGAVDSYDAFVRDPEIARALVPDLVLRLGGPPTSKALAEWFARIPGQQLVLSEESQWADPTPVSTLHLHGDVDATLAALLDLLPQRQDGGYRDLWARLQEAARRDLDAFLDDLAEPFEGTALRTAARALGSADLLFVGNSMPVRDLDSFAARTPFRVLCNRGANGIDGVVSAATGAAAVHGGRTLLAIGDVSFQHDIGGLLLSRMHRIDLTVLLLNNDGGGIFSFLPQSREAQFEELFGTPHGLDFSHAAALYGAGFVRPEPAGLAAALAQALESPGLQVVEVRTDRARNRELHLRAFARAASAVRAALAEVPHG